MMKCQKHNIEMLYGGEDGDGNDVWFCEQCLLAEEAEIERRNEPDEFDAYDEDGWRYFGLTPPQEPEGDQS